jgi:hypothetical protein
MTILADGGVTALPRWSEQFFVRDLLAFCGLCSGGRNVVDLLRRVCCRGDVSAFLAVSRSRDETRLGAKLSGSLESGGHEHALRLHVVKAR